MVVGSVPRMPPTTPPHRSMATATPHLVGRDSGPFLLYSDQQALWGQPYDWDGQPLGDTLPPLSFPVIGVLTAEGNATGTCWGAILEGDPDAPVFWLLQQGPGGAAQALYQIPEMLPFVMEGHLSDNGRTVAFAWGETFGEGRVGPHAVVADRDTGQIQYGPAVVDAPAAGTASYSVWAVVAPHPDGHALVWGGWREQGNYGIYGKVLRCR